MSGAASVETVVRTDGLGRVHREPIILTGSKDNNMLLGELDAQDYA